AGNVESSKTVTVRLDKTAPTITATRTPAPDANGWNKTAVTVTFACIDTGGSGLAAGSPPAPVTLSSDGANQQVTKSCVDIAGNSASATVGSINIATIAPVTTGTPSPLPNAAGW